MTDEELVLAIRAAYPGFLARLERGEILVRKLTYVKKGPSIAGVVAVDTGVKEGCDG